MIFEIEKNDKNIQSKNIIFFAYEQRVCVCVVVVEGEEEEEEGGFFFFFFLVYVIGLNDPRPRLDNTGELDSV